MIENGNSDEEYIENEEELAHIGMFFHALVESMSGNLEAKVVQNNVEFVIDELNKLYAPFGVNVVMNSNMMEQGVSIVTRGGSFVLTQTLSPFLIGDNSRIRDSGYTGDLFNEYFRKYSSYKLRLLHE